MGVLQIAKDMRTFVATTIERCKPFDAIKCRVFPTLIADQGVQLVFFGFRLKNIQLIIEELGILVPCFGEVAILIAMQSAIAPKADMAAGHLGDFCTQVMMRVDTTSAQITSRHNVLLKNKVTKYYTRVTYSL